MRTLKSRRHAWAAYNADPEAQERRQAKRIAAIAAAPAPVYPDLAPLTGDWIGGRINGQTVIVQLQREHWHRCDQWAALIDGKVVSAAAGLTLLWALLKSRWGRAPSLRAMATMQQSYTAADEQDAATAQACQM
jgi:hypothetical protein